MFINTISTRERKSHPVELKKTLFHAWKKWSFRTRRKRAVIFPCCLFKEIFDFSSEISNIKEWKSYLVELEKALFHARSKWLFGLGENEQYYLSSLFVLCDINSLLVSVFMLQLRIAVSLYFVSSTSKKSLTEVRH